MARVCSNGGLEDVAASICGCSACGFAPSPELKLQSILASSPSRSGPNPGTPSTPLTALVKLRPATSWFDYYEKEDDSGITKADKVKQEFWIVSNSSEVLTSYCLLSSHCPYQIREYPGIIEEKDENGVIISSRPATSWFDYYEKEDDSGVTKVDKVKQEFWNAFCVSEADKVEADRVLENYAAKLVRQMMYQLLVDFVKVYHDKIGEEIDDALARPKELEVDEYKDGPIDWCRDNEFSYLVDYWCTEEFKAKRKSGQQARLNSEDVAQNRGGSRPFIETQQYMGVKFGPATLNTFSAMKTGFKNIDNDGNIGPIPSQKAQKRVTDYLTGLRAKYPDDWQQRDLDENVLYSTNGGLPHGRIQIANGAVRKANILAVAKSTNVRPANSIAFQNMAQQTQNMARQNEQLLRENQYMRKKQERTDKLLLALYEKLGEQVPQELDCPVEEEDPFAQGTSSSHVVSQLVEDNGNNNNDGCNTTSGNGGNNNGDNNCNGNNTSSLNANDGSNIGGNNNSGGCNTSTS
uniref:Uncharacterized protein n=1 Tax=Oryza meridionalis TaxID=40149 RepID=A0A0E0C280_9ORYZ